MMAFDRLPDELVLEVIYRLRDKTSFLSFTSTCKRFCHLAQTVTTSIIPVKNIPSAFSWHYLYPPLAKAYYHKGCDDDGCSALREGLFFLAKMKFRKFSTFILSNHDHFYIGCLYDLHRFKSELFSSSQAKHNWDSINELIIRDSDIGPRRLDRVLAVFNQVKSLVMESSRFWEKSLGLEMEHNEFIMRPLDKLTLKGVRAFKTSFDYLVLSVPVKELEVNNLLIWDYQKVSYELDLSLLNYLRRHQSIIKRLTLKGSRQFKDFLVKNETISGEFDGIKIVELNSA